MNPIVFAQHAPVEAFGCQGGELAFGMLPVTRLAAQAGGTPFYAYHRAAIRDRVAQLRLALPASVRVHYAMKANPMPAVVHLLATLVDGLDVASAAEMQVALDAGVDPGDIGFAGPGKTADEIERAVAAGVDLSLESAAQCDLALAAGERLGVEPRLAIRVNPAFELKAAGMKMGGGPRPFGVDETLVPALAARIEAAGLRLRGLHVYAGSQNLSAAALVQAQRQSLELALRLHDGLRGGIDWLNLGGGFGVPYFPAERPLDLLPIGQCLAELAERAHAAMRAPLVLELGRWLVAEAGVYVCRVLERKLSQGQVFLITDGGLHHHLAASGNFGQVIRRNYPVAIANRLDAPCDEVQTVVGPLCTPLDVLADRMPLASAQPGDLVAVFRSGAYGRSASPSAFLSHPPAREVLV
jgi:diaminopimelate decarboxylase